VFGLCRRHFFAVQRFVAVHYLQKLPCKISLSWVLLAAHGKDVFTVHGRMTTIYRTTMPFFPVVYVPTGRRANPSTLCVVLGHEDVVRGLARNGPSVTGLCVSGLARHMKHCVGPELGQASPLVMYAYKIPIQREKSGIPLFFKKKMIERKLSGQNFDDIGFTNFN
jgi:hypothetical protein